MVSIIEEVGFAPLLIAREKCFLLPNKYYPFYILLPAFFFLQFFSLLPFSI